MIITAAVALTLIVAGSIALNIINRDRRLTARAIGREQAAHRELSAFAEALERFKADVQRYPTNEEGLRCLSRKPAAFEATGSSSYWFGPYLETVPEVDPWGNDYEYHTPDGGRSFELYSPGPGGSQSGSDSRFRVRSQGSPAM